MTTRKNNNNMSAQVRTNRTKEVKQATKQVKATGRTFNAVARALSEPANTAQGKTCLAAMRTLGVHVPSLDKLTAGDFFTAWWGSVDKNGNAYGLKDKDNNLQMFKSCAYEVRVNGSGYALHTRDEKTSAYKRVNVYCKRTLLSVTEPKFDPKKHLYPTVDRIAEGLAQCALSTEWCKKADRAQARAEKLNTGYINMGTSTEPNWVMVVKNNNTWVKLSVKKSGKKSA